MGHTCLGTIPTSKKWKAVVAEVADFGSANGNAGDSAKQDDISDIARLAIEAAQGGLTKAIGDEGLQYTFYMLAQLVLAARTDEWPERLASMGMPLASDASVFDLTVRLQAAIDRHIQLRSGSTDFSEMAQQAAGEAIKSLVGPEASSLFGSTREDLRLAVARFSTKDGFSRVGQTFFGRFMSRFLNFYLSRVTAERLGESSIGSVSDVSQFNTYLTKHCEETAKIVRDFSGQWYSKTQYEEGITPQNTSRFMAVALKKLRAELRRQGGER